MTNKTQNEVIANFNTATDENNIKSKWKLFQQIRKEILAQNWEFSGSVESYKPPQLVTTFLRWVLIGPHSSDKGRTKQLETVIEVAIKVIVQNIKLNRQTQYHQQRTESLLYFKIEKPLNIGLGLYFYYVLRSKKLINFR